MKPEIGIIECTNSSNCLQVLKNADMDPSCRVHKSPANKISENLLRRRVFNWFLRLGIQLFSFILPSEAYRKFMVNDSEKRYAQGRWNYLREASESHRYSLIVGCCQLYTPPHRRVLDIGCGEGILTARLAQYGSYVGVDMNATAIAMAANQAKEDTVFVQANAESFEPLDQFDVIVFNESLHYIPNPTGVFDKYLTFLARGGVVIVSMFHVSPARLVWKHIRASGMIELTRVTINNELGITTVATFTNVRERL
ncbi:MAG: class I SAM-dependent methyltransferase [Elusimicrobia bacterium]|nr:class I SAM-dependent methyltransferase [Elusimicrobiota bacterium]